jgi:hypothetical protein
MLVVLESTFTYVGKELWCSSSCMTLPANQCNGNQGIGRGRQSYTGSCLGRVEIASATLPGVGGKDEGGYDPVMMMYHRICRGEKQRARNAYHHVTPLNHGQAPPSLRYSNASSGIDSTHSRAGSNEDKELALASAQVRRRYHAGIMNM